MATKAFLDAAPADLTSADGVNPRAADLVNQVVAQANPTVNTVTGPTAGVLVESFMTGPLSGFTLAGTITLNLWMVESGMNANAGAQVVIDRVDNAGNFISTVLNSERGIELGTVLAVQNWTAAPTSTVIATGDRLVMKIYANDVGVMGTGFTVTLRHGDTLANSGDSWIQFTETVSLAVTATLLPTSSLSALGGLQLRATSGLSLTAALAAQSFLTLPGVSALGGSASLSAVATVTHNASAALPASGLLTISAFVVYTASLALPAGAVASPSASLQARVQSALSTALVLSAVAVLTKAAIAGLTGSASLLATTAGSVDGVLTLAPMSSLSALPGLGLFGIVQLSPLAFLGVSGQRSAFGLAALASQSDLNVTPLLVLQGESSLVSSAQIAPFGAFPSIMADVSLVGTITVLALARVHFLALVHGRGVAQSTVRIKSSIDAVLSGA